MIHFAATTLMTEHTEENLLVFHLSSDDHYLTIQRRADLRPGRFGDIRFECDGQLWSGYDVIRELRWSAVELRVSLEPGKATRFEGRHEYAIELGIDPADKPAALRFLRKLLAGTGLLHEEISVQ
ncbi:MAG: hypothetical protein QM691_09890 [Opitutaceae bacterium]